MVRRDRKCKICKKILFSINKGMKRPDRKVSGLCHGCYVHGKNNHAWSGGLPNCFDCGKKLTVYKRKRCRSCWNNFYKGKNTARWTGGFPKCKTCKILLSNRYATYCRKHRVYPPSTVPVVKCAVCRKKLNRNAHNSGNKYCKTCVHLGKRSCLWKGGLTKLGHSIRNSAKNKKWIKKILERDCFACILCGKVGKLHVDHFPVSFANLIKSLNIKTKKDAMSHKEFWKTENGRTLCVSCHKKTPTYLNHGR